MFLLGLMYRSSSLRGSKSLKKSSMSSLFFSGGGTSCKSYNFNAASSHGIWETKFPQYVDTTQASSKYYLYIGKEIPVHAPLPRTTLTLHYGLYLRLLAMLRPAQHKHDQENKSRKRMTVAFKHLTHRNWKRNNQIISMFSKLRPLKWNYYHNRESRKHKRIFGSKKHHQYGI